MTEEQETPFKYYYYVIRNYDVRVSNMGNGWRTNKPKYLNFGGHRYFFWFIWRIDWTKRKLKENG